MEELLDPVCPDDSIGMGRVVFILRMKNSFMLACDLTAERAEFHQCETSLLVIRRLPVPFVFVFHKVHAFARNRVADNDRRIFVDCPRFVCGVDDLLDVVPINLDDAPVECAKFISQWFKGQNILREAINLNIVAINERRNFSQIVFAGEKNRFPRLSFVKLSIAHEAPCVPFFFVHSRRKRHSDSL